MWLVAVVGRCLVGCEHCEGYCWMWLVEVVGRCVVGYEHCEGYCWMWLVAVVDCLKFEDGTNRFSRNVASILPFYAA